MRQPIPFSLAVAAAILSLSWAGAPARAADSLDAARAAGMSCEQPDGYARATPTATADVQTLVASINDKRKAQYIALAQEKGYPIEAVVLEVWDKRLKQFACK
jgi:uncharacterized protein YdbL (DUF1318 family)